MVEGALLYGVCHRPRIRVSSFSFGLLSSSSSSSSSYRTITSELGFLSITLGPEIVLLSLEGIRSAWRLPRAAVGLCPLLLPSLCGRNGAPSPSIPIGTMPMRRQSMSNPGSLMRERYMGREWDHRILTSVRSDVLQQRLRDISRQREELQQIEIELRAQTIVRPEIMDMQNSYEAQLKEHTNASAKLEEQLQEREQYIQELELKVEEKDRELHAVNNEVHRVAQDAILLKDEQLREAHAWILRLQEMGALQSSSLQAELRERTDQFHQYYLGFQCQVMDMERNHMQAIQQLQSELAVAREQNGVQSNGSQAISGSFIDCLLYDKSHGNESNANDSVTSNGTLKFMSNGQLNGAASFVFIILYIYRG